MSASLHLLGLESAPESRDSERIRVVRPTDVNRGAPVFRAPTLPTAHQFASELPFSVHFPRKEKIRAV